MQKASAVKQTISQSLRSMISATKKLETPSRIDHAHGLNVKFDNMNLKNDSELIDLPAVDLLLVVESRPLNLGAIFKAKEKKNDIPFVGFVNLIEKHENLVQQINAENYPYSRLHSKDDIKSKFPKLNEIWNLYKSLRKPIAGVLRAFQDDQNIVDDDQSDSD